MTEQSVITLTTPFQNLKFLIILNKILGLVSCKLVNGRFKPSGIWNRSYCVVWILLHCIYSTVYYYLSFTTSSAKKASILHTLSILRYTAFLVSLFPYHYVVIARSQNFVKFSDKLEAYDDKAATLGYQRKDKHLFTWLFFTYTFFMLTMKTYYIIISNIPQGMIITITFDIIPIVVGTFCVFITGIFLDAIRQRFHHLNNTIIPHIADLSAGLHIGSQNEITVYDVRYLHSVLIDSAELINAIYGIGTLLTFTSILLEFVAVIYLFIIDVKSGATLVTILDLSFQVIYLFMMYHITTLEVNRVEECIEKYGLSFQTTKCRMDKIEMMLYFYHSRFSFTAAEFFILDLTILLSIASTVATFITLIV